jgi:predicted transcriptional regulator
MSQKEQGIVYVTTDDDLKTVLSCFKINNISHVPVMSEQKLVGIISKTDVVEYLYNNQENWAGQSFDSTMQSILAKELMVQPLIEARTSDPQQVIIEKLLSHQVGSVVIRDDSGKMAGIVTEKDMLQYLVNNQDSDVSLTENLGGQLVQWMDQHGILRISKALADIGI